MISFKWLGITLLSLATVTACATPPRTTLSPRAAVRQHSLETTASISSGACDDVGQFIPGQRVSITDLRLEASAAPKNAP